MLKAVNHVQNVRFLYRRVMSMGHAMAKTMQAMIALRVHPRGVSATEKIVAPMKPSVTKKAISYTKPRFIIRFLARSVTFMWKIDCMPFTL